MVVICYLDIVMLFNTSIFITWKTCVRCLSTGICPQLLQDKEKHQILQNYPTSERSRNDFSLSSVILIICFSCNLQKPPEKLKPPPPYATGDVQGLREEGWWGGGAWRNQSEREALRLTIHELHRAERNPLERPQVLWSGSSGSSGSLQGNQCVSVREDCSRLKIIN